MGGKGADGVYQRIINRVPRHQVAIHAFAGEASIARLMRPSAETILIDLERLPAIDAPALAHCTFVQAEAIAWLDGRDWQGDEFVYADPPYLPEARACPGRAYYAHELNRQGHENLLEVLLNLDGLERRPAIMLSGYASALYDRALAHWHHHEFNAMTRGGRTAREVLWCNYPRPVALHDYRFVGLRGEDFRARCRMRRQLRNIVAKLARLPALERNAMFSFLAQAMPREKKPTLMEVINAPAARPAFMGMDTPIRG